MTKAADVRAQLDHPVVDADGHHIEYLPLVRDLIAEYGGGAAADAFDVIRNGAAMTRTLDADTQHALGTFRVSWWGLPTAQTLDRATAMLPALLDERLAELGIDVSILYPTYGLTVMGIDDSDVRVAAAKAFNTYAAEAFAPHSRRLLPVAVVPTYEPDEAIAVLDHATQALGLRAVMCTGLVQRPLPGDHGVRGARWLDALGLDSARNYDPFWHRCDELGITPTFHSTGMGWGSRVSPTNYVANHLGSFAAAGEALCRSLYLGGVMHRFPTLRFAFLEGGVAWAASLCADLVGHWEKRNREAIEQYNPARLDTELLRELFEKHATPRVRERLDALADALRMLSDPDEDPSQLDEFRYTGVRDASDIRATFRDRLFFGCEADDPSWALAFASQYHGTMLGAMFASDLGHWDVPDAREVLPEAFELLERGHVDAAQFRAFTYDNARRCWGEAVFAGTAAEFG